MGRTIAGHRIVMNNKVFNFNYLGYRIFCYPNENILIKPQKFRGSMKKM
jgi:hypothetical protein